MSGRGDLHGWNDRSAERWLDDLRVGRRIGVPALVVAAHPDDETIGFGLRLSAFADLTLVHVTDGAPEVSDDARRAGFPDRAAYAQARAGELAAALAALGVAPRRVALGVVDQQAVLRLPWLVEQFRPHLSAAELVITHAYEGGHPDHDAAALAVQLACDRLVVDGRRAPLRLEFAGYHAGPAGRVASRFWPDPERPEIRPVPTSAQLAAKRAALACHRSQAAVIGWFDPANEAYRAAPRYDFTGPPPPGAALYDSFGWALSSAGWRDHAGAALAALKETA